MDRRSATTVLRGQTLAFRDDPFKVEPDAAVDFHADGAVAISDGKIVDAGSASAVLERHPDALIESYGQQHLIMAGFVDCHVHYPQIDIVASFGEQLLAWLEKYTFPAEARFHERGHAAETAIVMGSAAVDAVVLSRGSATQAILAAARSRRPSPRSRSMGRLLCDGAVASSTPVRAAVARGAQRLIVLPTGSAHGLQRPPADAIASLLHAITLLTARQLAGELDRLGESTECHILPTACPMGVSPFDFSRTPELIQRAY